MYKFSLGGLMLYENVSKCLWDWKMAWFGSEKLKMAQKTWKWLISSKSYEIVKGTLAIFLASSKLIVIVIRTCLNYALLTTLAMTQETEVTTINFICLCPSKEDVSNWSCKVTYKGLLFDPSLHSSCCTVSSSKLKRDESNYGLPEFWLIYSPPLLWCCKLSHRAGKSSYRERHLHVKWVYDMLLQPKKHTQHDHPASHKF